MSLVKLDGTEETMRDALAITELEYRAELFNRMLLACREHCTKFPHREGRLENGEHHCLDTCVHKYKAVSRFVGRKLGINLQ
mmetsp:Transcript_19384/g.35004  ORF Transcript_19384/g.35004 Transcript_19384/m.35004 type:complete len:82 (-) Transcript_19384:551-796(-)